MSSEFALNVLIAVMAVGIVALAGWLPPQRRWDRQLRRDAELWHDLPDGEFRNQLEVSIQKQTKRLTEYRQAFRGRVNVFNWVALLIPVVLLTTFLVIPNPFRGLDFMDWGELVIVSLVGIFGFVSVVSGRNSDGQTAAEYPGYRRRQYIRYRLRRVQRKEKSLARRARKAQKRKPSTPSESS